VQDHVCAVGHTDPVVLHGDTWLVEQIRAGDAEVGHCFVGEHYGVIYSYLLSLTGQPEGATDLTQSVEPYLGAEGDSGGG
jgi:hypothetical protein